MSQMRWIKEGSAKLGGPQHLSMTCCHVKRCPNNVLNVELFAWSAWPVRGKVCDPFDCNLANNLEATIACVLDPCMNGF